MALLEMKIKKKSLSKVSKEEEHHINGVYEVKLACYCQADIQEQNHINQHENESNSLSEVILTCF